MGCDVLISYVSKIRRKLYKYPELGFDVPKTLAIANEEKKKTYGIHCSKFDIDEESFGIGVKILKQFVFDNMAQRL